MIYRGWSKRLPTATFGGFAPRGRHELIPIRWAILARLGRVWSDRVWSGAAGRGKLRKVGGGE